MTKSARIVSLIAGVAAMCAPAMAQRVISSSELPCVAPRCTSGGFGYDICTDQTMAIMMYPLEDAQLERISLWLFDIDSTTRDAVTVTVREGNDEGPSSRILERFSFIAPATRVLEPQMVTLQSVVRPLIQANRSYWMVVESPAVPGRSSSWAAASGGGGIFTTAFDNRWNQVQWGPWGAHLVEGSAPSRVCVADIDDGSGTGRRDGGVGVEDLTYFLRLLAEGSSAADVDDGSGNGTRDNGVGIEDLIYFVQRFESGC
jgi:hypothetical protein